MLGKRIPDTFQVRHGHLQSMLIFAIFNLTILVPFRFIVASLSFNYPGKRLFQGFIIFKGNSL